MRRFPWLFLLVPFLAVGCNLGACNDDKPEVLDLAKGPVTKAAAPARDPIVKMAGPSVVFVKQSNRTRFLQVWIHERSGEIKVPLRDLDDGSGPLTIDVWPRSSNLQGAAGLKQLEALPLSCPDCAHLTGQAHIKCCLLQQLQVE